MNIELTLNPILPAFSPIIREIIRNTLTDLDFGISGQPLRINAGSTKMSPNEYMEKYIDSFKLEIPYAGKTLEWEVIFQEEDFAYAPDFNFINDSFLSDPDVNVINDHVPSLSKWNVADNKCFNRVIREFLVLYKELQLLKFQTETCYSRLSSEYDDLLKNSSLSNTDVELYIDTAGAVHILMPILVDFTCIPPYVQEQKGSGECLNPHKDIAKLKISFSKPEYSKIQSTLQLTPRLEQVIGSATNLRIPVYKKDTTLSAYVTEITKLLKNRVTFLADHYRMKNDFITTLIAECGLNIVEYDNILFSKATLLFNVNEVYALVIICLGDKFPQEKPKLTLNSIYYLKNDKPYSQILDAYPYSPRWKCDEIIKRLLIYLQEQIPKFHAVAQQNFSI
ncbi:hypothetical protein PPYR_06177 [Photinus pyralis]|uniref:BRISC and BRCA1-A complex member 2 n=1 Tax=Photinus pyralis TaxID=7054 RepID=A0A1Y1NFG9_PHOPY|nr:BRISC and BRCA1-A complex member 2-like [Photinus pyralis]KAB0800437.1 hypothetical protein PPYR_06177 [Photinus pyralis]